MPTTILLFFAGILTTTLFSHIPSFSILIPIFICSILVLYIKSGFITYIATLFLGCAWALIYAHFISNWTWPHSLENKVIKLEGVVASLPDTNENNTTFNFEIANLQNKFFPLGVKLSWHKCKSSLHIGEKWRLFVKLKRPHALRNPGSFDIEKTYFQQHICALGNVITSPNNCRLKAASGQFIIQRAREWLVNNIPQNIKNSPFFGIIVALSLGITSKISISQWQVFRATGTNHLIAISGLHIGLVAALSSILMRKLWGRLPNAALRMPTSYVQALSSLIAAIIYSLLAGLSASTQRALIMILVTTLATLTCRQLSTFRALVIALGIINLINPFTFLANGFWLSFIAVGVLIYGMNARLNSKGAWYHWKPQWVVCIGMLPTIIFFFQQASLISLPSNFLAIPWISFLVVPCCLLGIALLPVSKMLSATLLQVAIYLLQCIWFILERLAGLSNLIWHPSFQNVYHIVLANIAAFITLLPEGMLNRFVASIWCLACFLMPTQALKPNQVQIVVFDVGQGLATLVRTAHHTIVYDTGAKLNANFDMGKAVIIPYLMRKGIKTIDLLTVSHGDNDHIGGAESILQAIPVRRIVTSVPDRFSKQKALFCTDNIEWQWDGVKFKFLSPPDAQHFVGNNASCVLKVINGKQSILLTGDIEKKAEHLLIKNHRHELKSTILLAPHHGSKTSSTYQFIKAVLPKYVIFSCGYLNSYHHPHRVIVNRYEENHVSSFSTVLSGAIIMTLSADSDIVTYEEYRKNHHKIWHKD